MQLKLLTCRSEGEAVRFSRSEVFCRKSLLLKMRNKSRTMGKREQEAVTSRRRGSVDPGVAEQAVVPPQLTAIS